MRSERRRRRRGGWRRFGLEDVVFRQRSVDGERMRIGRCRCSGNCCRITWRRRRSSGGRKRRFLIRFRIFIFIAIPKVGKLDEDGTVEITVEKAVETVVEVVVKIAVEWVVEVVVDVAVETAVEMVVEVTVE